MATPFRWYRTSTLAEYLDIRQGRLAAPTRREDVAAIFNGIAFGLLCEYRETGFNHVDGVIMFLYVVCTIFVPCAAVRVVHRVLRDANLGSHGR
jgi:hypothetical protein